jgi:hypothetical protein
MESQLVKRRADLQLLMLVSVSQFVETSMQLAEVSALSQLSVLALHLKTLSH